MALLDARNGEPLHDLSPSFSDAVSCLEFSNAGARLAAAGYDRKLVLWTLSKDEEGTEWRSSAVLEALPRYKGASSGRVGYSLAWSPNEQLLAVTDGYGRGRLLAEDGTLIETWRGESPGGTTKVIWRADSDRLLIVDSATVYWRHGRTGVRLPLVEAGGELTCPDPVVVMAVHPNGTQLVTGHRRRCARWWSLNSGTLLAEREFPPDVFDPERDEVAALAFDSTGKRLALSTREGSIVYVLDARSREILWESEWLGAHFWEAMELTWSPDDSRLWAAFECGGGDLYCFGPELGKDRITIESSPIPRFGGSIGVLCTFEGLGAVRLDGERVW